MTTLLTVGSSDGSRRCDATCHDAKGSRCTCCCGGRYHGLGGAGALQQLRVDILGDPAATLLAELDAAGVKLTDSIPRQLELRDLLELEAAR